MSLTKELSHQFGGDWTTKDGGMSYECDVSSDYAAKLRTFFKKHYTLYKMEYRDAGDYHLTLQSNADKVLILAKMETGNFRKATDNGRTVQGILNGDYPGLGIGG